MAMATSTMHRCSTRNRPRATAWRAPRPRHDHRIDPHLARGIAGRVRALQQQYVMHRVRRARRRQVVRLPPNCHA
jgi:hypothetical protein